ncbi:hypothetical protein KKA14_16450, partial [bacterium]|nr:hypothetical protein [bacterium]
IPNNDFSGGNHLGYINYQKVLEKGIESMIDEYQSASDSLNPAKAESDERQTFYQSAIISLKAAIEFSRGYALKAKTLAEHEPSSERKIELEEIARIATLVPGKPATSFREAIQSFWFIVLALMQLDIPMELPFGRLDQFLYPFFKNDIESRHISYSEAHDLIAELFIKFNRLPHLKESAVTTTHDGGFPRTATLGGINSEGKRADNELSILILNVADRLRLTHPNIAVRLHPESSTAFKETTFRLMTNGSNLLHVFNDQINIKGFTNLGFTLRQARDYIITGCVQPIAADTYGSTCSMYVNGPKILEMVLNGGNPIVSLTGISKQSKNTRFEKFQDLFDAFKETSKIVIQTGIKGLTDVHDIQRHLFPNPILSTMIEGSLESGKDIKTGGAKNNISGISLIGLGTIVDSLVAIKQIVYEEKKHTFQEVLQWLKNGFSGEEKIQHYLQNKTSKYGNDHPETDSIAREIVSFLHDLLQQNKTYRGGSYTLGLHSENLHVLMGQLTAATPDGRSMGDPLSPGCGPSSGMDQNGPTASLNSISKIDYTKVMGGGSANFRFDPKLHSNEDQLNKFGVMVDVFFEQGGPHMQVNAVTTETLKNAQIHPEKHQNLIVRITGYSARFTALASITQNEIIKRSEMR